MTNIEWVDVGWRDRTEQDRLAAAQLQHHIAVAARHAISARHGTLRRYTRRLDSLRYGRLSELLRGNIVMRLEDVARLQRTLDIALELGAPERPSPDD